MKKRILETVKEHDLFGKGAHIVLGLSGGPDSVCLFDVLCDLADEMELTIHPVHVNHKFRPGIAEEEQDFVEKLCEERGWPCRSFTYDCNVIAKTQGLTPEEAGRNVRYEAFGRVAEELILGMTENVNCAEDEGFNSANLSGRNLKEPIARENVVIAVAQNANDQSETVLFRIMRGTGIDGLSGIAYKRYDEHGTAVVRPLIDVTRDKIENYCETRNLKPRHDHTNEETVYTRNKIRLELIPYIKKNFNENIIASVNRLAGLAAIDKDYIRKEALKAYDGALTSNSEMNQESGAVKGNDSDMESPKPTFNIEKLRNLHPSIRFRVYNRALGEVGLSENVTTAHLDEIQKVVDSNNPSAYCMLPLGVRVRKEYDKLIFQGAGSAAAVDKFANEASVNEASANTVAILKAQFSCDALEARYGKGAGDRIVFRNREPGDYITISTGEASGRKKLQDLFVDLKIPRERRDDILLAAIGKEVLWVLPTTETCGKLGRKGRFSADYKVDSKNGDNLCENIITLEILV